MAEELFERSPHNPLITVDQIPYPAEAACNPGVVEHAGRVVLLLQVKDRHGISHLTVARSQNGVDNWQIEPMPLISPDPRSTEHRYEEYGCEDPRITYLPEFSLYAICYTAVSAFGRSVAAATTRDFTTVCKMGLILPPGNKDAALFPRRINNRWFMLHRPLSGDLERIWSTCSPDLVHWGDPQCLLPENGGLGWNGARVGVGAPPIETQAGWLLIYHGVESTAGGAMHRLSLALADLQNPAKLLGRTASWVMSLPELYEHPGDVPNVIHACGAILRGDEVWMYYGAADTCVCLARAKLSKLLDYLQSTE